MYKAADSRPSARRSVHCSTSSLPNARRGTMACAWSVLSNGGLKTRASLACQTAEYHTSTSVICQARARVQCWTSLSRRVPQEKPDRRPTNQDNTMSHYAFSWGHLELSRITAEKLDCTRDWTRSLPHEKQVLAPLRNLLRCTKLTHYSLVGEYSTTLKERG